MAVPHHARSRAESSRKASVSKARYGQTCRPPAISHMLLYVVARVAVMLLSVAPSNLPHRGSLEVPISRAHISTDPDFEFWVSLDGSVPVTGVSCLGQLKMVPRGRMVYEMPAAFLKDEPEGGVYIFFDKEACSAGFYLHEGGEVKEYLTFLDELPADDATFQSGFVAPLYDDLRGAKMLASFLGKPNSLNANFVVAKDAEGQAWTALGMIFTTAADAFLKDNDHTFLPEKPDTRLTPPNTLSE